MNNLRVPTNRQEVVDHLLKGGIVVAVGTDNVNPRTIKDYPLDFYTVSYDATRTVQELEKTAEKIADICLYRNACRAANVYLAEREEVSL